MGSTQVLQVFGIGSTKTSWEDTRPLTSPSPALGQVLVRLIISSGCVCLTLVLLSGFFAQPQRVLERGFKFKPRERLMRTNFQEALAFTLPAEGGVDHSNSTNRVESNYGITQGTLNDYVKEEKLKPISVVELTPEYARKIYLKKYYKEPRIAELPDKVREVVFDYGVNAYPPTAIRAMQEVLGVKTDGVIGPKTLAAVAKADTRELVNGILDQRQGFYNRLAIAKPATFGTKLAGWTNRVNAQRIP